MTKTNYTFGDSDEASLRLRNLAKLYELDAGEMDLLESSLMRIASGLEDAGSVLNTARQIIAQS